MYEGKLTADGPSWFRRHSGSCLADFSRYSKRLMLPASFWVLIILKVLQQFVFRRTPITFPVSSNQTSTIPWRGENPLELQEPSTLTLTSVTSSSKSFLGVYKVLLTRYILTSNATFSHAIIANFYICICCSFCVPLPSYFRNRRVIFSTLVSFLAKLCPRPIKRHAKTNKRLISKNWPFLFDIFAELFIFDFQSFSFWRTIFKKQAKPTDLSLFACTRIGLLQNMQTVKELTKVDNFSKVTFFLKKTFHAVQSHYVTQLLNQGNHRNIYRNTSLFHIHIHWSISLGCNMNFFRI